MTLLGIVGRPNEPLQQADLEVIDTARIGCVKSSCIETVPLLKILQPPSTDEFANIVRKAHGMDYNWFIIHRHPNCAYMGFGHYWFRGEEFADWWIEVRNAIAAELPDAKWGVPAMRPSGDLGKIFANSEAFFEECREAVEAADFFEMEIRWKREEDILPSIWRVDSYQRRFPDKLAVVNFCNINANVSKREKAEQYLRFYEELDKRDNVLAALIFCISSRSPSHKFVTFRSETGIQKPNAIPRILGDRCQQHSQQQQRL
jgi:hypothetical protein